MIFQLITLLLAVIVAGALLGALVSPRPLLHELRRRLRIARKALRIAGFVAACSTLWTGRRPARAFLHPAISGGAPDRKQVAHRVHLSMAAAAAGAAADTVADIYTYNAFPNGTATANAGGSIDPTAERLVELVLIGYATLTGQAANFVGVRVTHRDSTGAVKNRVRLDFNAAGVVLTANVPASLSVASAAVVPGAGTGTLTVENGVAPQLGWDLVNGDSITLERITTGTGLATPALALNALVATRQA